MNASASSSRVLRGSVALLATSSIGLTGSCGGTTPDPTRSPVTVLAAASLSDVFAELEQIFEFENPDLDVLVATGGSQVMRLQIEEGAPADVFASADASHVTALIEGGLATGRTVFAVNRLTMAVSEGSGSSIRGASDLPKVGRIVLGTPEVPIGRYSRELLGRIEAEIGNGFTDRVMARVASLELNARLVLAKVELGEADAAIVYLTDVTPSRRVRRVAIPDRWSVHAPYHTTAIVGSANLAGAGRWIDFLGTSTAQAVLLRHGFLLPAGHEHE